MDDLTWEKAKAEGRKNAEALGIEVVTLCPIDCDDDCEEPCHAVHHVRWKREHEPEDCPRRGL